MSRKTIVAILALGLAAPVAAQAQGMDGGGFGGEGPGMAFEMFDTDGDGMVTEAEITAFRQARTAGVDADADGMISEAELVAHMMQGMQSRAEAMAKRRIEAQDADGDGKLSAAELLAPPVPAGLFTILDVDGDGSISAEEFEAAKAKMAGRRGDRGDRSGRGEHGGRGGDGEHRGRGGDGERGGWGFGSGWWN